MKQSLIEEIQRGEFFRAYNGAKIPNSVLAEHDKMFFGQKDTETYRNDKHRAFRILCLVYLEEN